MSAKTVRVAIYVAVLIALLALPLLLGTGPALLSP
jgi:hypothetical protein